MKINTLVKTASGAKKAIDFTGLEQSGHSYSALKGIAGFVRNPEDEIVDKIDSERAEKKQAGKIVEALAQRGLTVADVHALPAEERRLIREQIKIEIGV